MTDLQQQQDPNAGGQASNIPAGGPTSADVTQNALAIQAHIDDVKDDFADVEKQAKKESPAAEHTGLMGAIAKFRNTLEHLTKHAAHVVGVAEKAETQPAAAAVESAKPVTRATSDAHLNVGNGGAVTGNPGASFTQASAAQTAVDQGAKIPGVATVPQPDAAVR